MRKKNVMWIVALGALAWYFWSKRAPALPTGGGIIKGEAPQ
jgi:hypothetical protein